MNAYQTRGVCARIIEVDTDGETVNEVKLYGGCRGQGESLARMTKGMKIDDVISRLKGIQCRNGTSCADQLARILELEKERKTLIV